MGVYSTSQFFGAFLGGVLGGALAQHFGYDAVFVGAALLAFVWLGVVWKMPAPRHLSSEVVSLDAHREDALDALMARFAAVAGVEDVLVVPEERVAYLKVDRQQLDTEALARVSGARHDQGNA
jgi:MFS family permease